MFFDSLHEFLLPSDAIIIAGDFNCYEYQFDKVDGNLSCAKYLSDFRLALNLIDAWHRLHPLSRQCTWFNSEFFYWFPGKTNFLSQNFFSFASNFEIKPSCVSDHEIVYLSIRLDDLCPRIGDMVI